MKIVDYTLNVLIILASVAACTLIVMGMWAVHNDSLADNYIVYEKHFSEGREKTDASLSTSDAYIIRARRAYSSKKENFNVSKEEYDKYFPGDIYQ